MWTEFLVAQCSVGPVTGFCDHGSEPSGCINPLTRKPFWVIFKTSVRAAKKTQQFAITMLFK
jgi:hypothetical protein